MNIVHQLRSKGDPGVRDIYEQVPWLEFWEYPTQPVEELIHRWDGLPTWYPRAFKTHAHPPVLPYRPNVRYIVVVRDPRDAIVSALPFIQAHNEEVMHEWGMHFKPDKVEQIWDGPAEKGNEFFKFVQAWWSLRNQSNVLLLHYSDMLKDHKGTIKRIQNFLKMELSPKEFENVCEYTSFKWMKDHKDKFSLQHLMPVPLMKEEAMVRSGKVGEGGTLPKALLEEFDQNCDKVLTPEQKAWMLNGGPLPK